MRQRSQQVGVLVAVAVLCGACASSQVQKAQKVSVDVHATLAAVQDAETALYQSGAVPQWTPARHADFNRHLVTALTAGKALNEAVRSVPVSPAAKLDLATVSQELVTLRDLVMPLLPADSAVAKAIASSVDAVLSMLPLFLQ